MHDLARHERASVRLETLRYSDLHDVLEIERQSFTAPWSLASFALELAKESTIRIAARGEAGALAGYLVCSRYAEIWHLMNVAVAPGFRRHGIATMMVRELLERLGPEPAVTLEVRESNHGAIAMYERLGFRPAGRRPGYYPDNGEAAVLMWLNQPSGI